MVSYNLTTHAHINENTWYLLAYSLPCKLLFQECYPAGAYIIREGAVGDTFFIISQGKVEVTVSKPKAAFNYDDSKKEPEFEVLRQLGYGDYFGEQALLKEEKRSANVVSLGCECLTLDRDSFLQLIGNLSEFKQHLKMSPPGTMFKPTETDKRKNLEPVSAATPAENEPKPPTEPQTSEVEGALSVLDPEVEINLLKLDDLEVIATLGVGGFGRVELVQVYTSNIFSAEIFTTYLVDGSIVLLFI